MEMTMQENELKLFVKIAKYFAYTGSELYMVFRPNSLQLKVVDPAETIIMSATFQREFFSKFVFSDMDPVENFNDAPVEDNKNTILLPIKFLLISLKASASLRELTISFDNSGTPERMHLSLLYKNRMRIRHNVCLFDIMDPHIMIMPLCDDGKAPLEVQVLPSIINKYVGNLINETHDFVLAFKKNCFMIRNYNGSIDDIDDMMLFDVKIERTQFIEYDMEGRNKITVAVSSNFLQTVNFGLLQNNSEVTITSYGSNKPISVSLKKNPNVIFEAIYQALNAKRRLHKANSKSKVDESKPNSASESIIPIPIPIMEPDIDEIEIEEIREEEANTTSKFKFKTPSEQGPTKKRPSSESSLVQDKRQKTMLSTSHTSPPLLKLHNPAPPAPSVRPTHKDDNADIWNYGERMAATMDSTFNVTLPNTSTFMENLPPTTSTQRDKENCFPLKVSAKMPYEQPLCEGSDEDYD